MTITGDAVPPVKLLAMFRAIYNPGHEAWPVHVAPTTIGSLILRIHPDAALNFVADIVVSLEGVRRFRDRMGITPGEPPPPCPRLEELEATDFRSTSESPDQVDQPPATRSRGRPPGSGSFAPADEPLVDEMRKILVANPAMSRTAAAQKVAHRADGQSFESKVSRLVKRYGEKFP